MDQNRMVRNGHDLVNALDGKGMHVGAAVWVHNTNVDTWKLWVVPRSKTEKREFNRQVAEAISNDKMRFADINASDTELVDRNHPAISALNSFAKVTGQSSMSMTNNMLNGYYMTDGIIVLMDL